MRFFRGGCSMLKEFMKYYLPYKKLFLLDFGSAVLVGLLELLFPLMTSIFIDELLPTEDWTWIVIAAISLLIVYLIEGVFKFIVTYWGHMLGTNIERDIRNELYSHLQKLNFSFYDKNKTGKLIGRLTNDLMDIGEVAHHGPEDLFVALMTLLGAFVILLTIDVKLALVTFFIIPIIFFVTIFFNQKMGRAFKTLFKNVSRFNEVISDNIGGIRLVQAFTNEKYELEQFKETNDAFRQTKLKAYNFMSWNTTISHISQKATLIIVLILGSYYVLHGDLSYGGFVAFIMITNVLFEPLRAINLMIEMFPKGYAGFSNFREIMEIEPEIQDCDGAIELTGEIETIEYDHVQFKYDEQHVLNDISFKIKHGEQVALVGPSGGGKSTICSLLPRFYAPSSGDIRINGTSLERLTLKSLRSYIGIVQQDVFLFAGTLRENIAYGHPDVDDSDIMKAVEYAQLKSFVDGLEEGLDTIVGERGTKLSGGQKQRVSIARMFIKNPPIIILDEATSALDVATEHKIQQAFDLLAKGRTSLVIAHRLSTIKGVDRILYIEEGHIVEQGTHDELMNLKGRYYALYMTQFEHLTVE